MKYIDELVKLCKAAKTDYSFNQQVDHLNINTMNNIHNDHAVGMQVIARDLVNLFHKKEPDTDRVCYKRINRTYHTDMNRVRFTNAISLLVHLLLVP